MAPSMQGLILGVLILTCRPLVAFDETPPSAASSQQASSSTRGESGAEPAKATSARQINVEILSADGRAVEGAEIRVIRAPYTAIDPLPQTLAASDSKGHAEFSVNDPGNGGFDDRAEVETFMVKAAGHGSVLLSSHDLLNSRDSSLLSRLLSGTSPRKIVLPKSPPPYRGRLISIDGQPLSNVRVSFRRLESMNAMAANRTAATDATPEKVVERVRHLVDQIVGLRFRKLLPTAVSNDEGWFEIPVPENEIAELLAERDDLETTAILVRNSEAPELPIPKRSNYADLHKMLLPNRASVVMSVSVPVTGRVVSAEAGEPIAGAVVAPCEIPGINFLSYQGREHFQTRCDAEGRYRITGLPLGNGLRLVTWATGEKPYVSVGAQLATKIGPPIEQDFRMPLGIWANIHVLDGETRESLEGRLEYNIFDEGKVRERFPGIRYAYAEHGHQLDREGRIQIAVLPTRAILAFSYQPAFRGGNQREDRDRYPRGGGMEAIGGMKSEGMRYYATLPHFLMPSDFTQLLEINPQPGSPDLNIEMEVRAAAPILVNVLDDQQRSVAGVQSYTAMLGGWIREESEQVHIKGIKTGETRRVFLFAPGRDLAGALKVSQPAKAPYSVVLQPAGRLRGRLVDEAGEPIPNIEFFPDYDRYEQDAEAGMWDGAKSVADPRTGRFRTDKEGRFEVVGLVPGWKYSAWLHDPSGQKQNFITDHLFENVMVKSGETQDLGDIAVDQSGKRKSR